MVNPAFQKIAVVWRAISGLFQKLRGQMPQTAVDDLRCDILLFFATQTEREQIEKGAGEFALPFEEKNDKRIGTYYSLGTIGPNRVRAVKTRMGSFFHQGSASQAIVLRAATSATSIIQVGMAFGIDRNAQAHGDVLISRWLFPYDYRIIKHLAGDNGNPDRYYVDYTETTKFRAKGSLLRLFEKEWTDGTHAFRIHFGGFLSGGSRIRSQLYLRELLRSVTGGEGSGGYVGGEMEGVGLLAASRRGVPAWAIVKGISDFADHKWDEEIEAMRATACLNAVRFVLAALRRAETVPAD